MYWLKMLLLQYQSKNDGNVSNAFVLYGVFSCCDLASFINLVSLSHDDIIKWKHFPRYWSFVQGIHRSPVNSPHKGQWRGTLLFSLICAWINGWVNNSEAGNLRRRRTHYDVTVSVGLM